MDHCGSRENADSQLEAAFLTGFPLMLTVHTNQTHRVIRLRESISGLRSLAILNTIYLIARLRVRRWFGVSCLWAMSSILSFISFIWRIFRAWYGTRFAGRLFPELLLRFGIPGVSNNCADTVCRYFREASVGYPPVWIDIRHCRHLDQRRIFDLTTEEMEFPS